MQQSKIKPGHTKSLYVEPEPGFNRGGTYKSASYKITEKAEAAPGPETKPAETKPPSGAQAPQAYNYPDGVGNMMMNGCYGSGYKPTDPCAKGSIMTMMMTVHKKNNDGEDGDDNDNTVAPRF